MRLKWGGHPLVGNIEFIPVRAPDEVLCDGNVGVVKAWLYCCNNLCCLADRTDSRECHTSIAGEWRTLHVGECQQTLRRKCEPQEAEGNP